ncbi:MAG: hypothetical protein JEY79_17360 [Pseudodesulfovibrio sp.]|nr:hypothetical protein [Pseudodesulfovibrio sp.]
MSLWTLAAIKSKVRKLTGRPDTGQLSDADLLVYINSFFLNSLPQVAPGTPLTQTQFTLSIASGDGGAYGLPTTIQRLVPSGLWVATRDSDDVDLGLTLMTDYNLFWSRWPESDDTTGFPEDVLKYNNTIYVRPLPDEDYTIKFPAIVANVALSDDTDTLDDDVWGPLIAFGAAMEILTDSGDHDEAAALLGVYEFHRTNVLRRDILSDPGRRSIPAF